MTKRRNTELQAYIFYVLLLIKNGGSTNPVPLVKLRPMVNDVRKYVSGRNSFTDSIHILAERGFLERYRDNKFKLAVALTEKGEEHARNVTKELFENAQ